MRRILCFSASGLMMAAFLLITCQENEVSAQRPYLLTQRETIQLSGGQFGCNNTRCKEDACVGCDAWNDTCSWRLGGECGKVFIQNGWKAELEADKFNSSSESTTVTCGSKLTGAYNIWFQCSGRCTDSTPCGGVMWTCQEAKCSTY